MQNKYWKLMTHYKFSLYYFDEHFYRYTKWDRAIKIFLGIFSSSAIASWVIWQHLSFIWAVIVASSQVITIINSYLPYKNRIKQIAELRSRLIPIYCDVEHKWYKVSEGLLSESEINDLCYNFSKEWSSIADEFFKDDSLPNYKTLINVADMKKNKYFDNCF